MKIHLKKSFFNEKAQLFFENGDLKVFLFRYESGVEAIRFENSVGHIVVLPYKGQMIWEAVFGGRTLNMYRIHKTEAKDVDFFLNSYGSFFFHCGALRMGCPAEKDTHPLHGELPYAPYDRAWLTGGSDERGEYVCLSGSYLYNRGFGPCYQAVPYVKFYSGSALLEISITITNLANDPMELMYQAHLNWRPVDNGRLVQSYGWTPEDMEPRMSVPRHFSVAPGYRDFLTRLKARPELTRVLRPEDNYCPEVCFYLHHPRTDADGRVHLMQVHPDGNADLLLYKPSECECGIRWISKTPNQNGLGLSFPSTCYPEGYLVEKANGRVKALAPGETFTSTLLAGALTPDEAVREEAFIDTLMRSE